MEPLDSASDHNAGPGFGESDPDPKQSNDSGLRAEIDTSAPFESVKEAVSMFGGVGFWKPNYNKQLHASSENGIEEEFDAVRAEEQAVQLANDLMAKERETLEVLKELEATKSTVEELKLKLQQESAAVNLKANDQLPREGNDKNALLPQSMVNNLMCPSSAPGLILMELKQAKLNLTRTTNDLADIRATVETYNELIEKEKLELEKTRKRLSSNPAKVLFFNEEVEFPRELKRLASETEEFKKAGDVAESEVLRATIQIEQIKRNIETVEARLVAAKKLKEAARASEALARSEIESISKSQTLSEEGVTLSYDEYCCLKLKAQEADEALMVKVNDAMVKVNESEVSKSEILNRVEEAAEEVKNSKKVLEEALSKLEAANNEKLKAEEALRKWRSDHGQRRKSTVQSSTKFKNSSSRTNSTRLLDVNGAHLGSNMSGPVLMPTMSIGQILSRKLLLTEEYSGKSETRSLAQMLRKPANSLAQKRKKFGFGRISFLVVKPSKKKKHSAGSRLSCATD